MLIPLHVLQHEQGELRAPADSDHDRNAPQAPVCVRRLVPLLRQVCKSLIAETRQLCGRVCMCALLGNDLRAL